MPKAFNLPADIDMAEFISKRAHDLRSPYNHVIGFTKMVLNEQSGPLTDLQKEDLFTSYKSAMRTLWVINNLIDIARLSRGEKAANRANVDINHLLDQAVAQWQKFNPDKDNVIANLVLTSAPTMQVDEHQIRQALTCFITFVLEHMQPGANVTLTVEDETDAWLVTVQAAGAVKNIRSEMDLEMTGYIGKKILELEGGEIRAGEVDESQAAIKFALPKN